MKRRIDQVWRSNRPTCGARLALVAASLVTGTACDEPPQPLATGLYASCYGGEGICLSMDLVSEEQRGLLEAESCQAGLLCIPRSLARGEVPSTCTSLADAEGRCLLSRLPRIVKQLDQIPASSCQSGQRCVPCFDLFTGAATGACSSVGDPGPTLGPKLFGNCCSNAGRCLPPTLIDAGQRGELARDACNQGELCVPQFVIDKATPNSCDSVDSAEGRCLPTCLPTVADQLDSLPVAACAAGQRCAPCYDPLSGESTGACNLAGDPGPREPAHRFGICCGDAGRCVPSDLVASDQRSSLGQDVCPADRLCAPVKAVEKQAPASCASLGSVEGRCLPMCLSVVAKQLDRLPRASCLDSERCAPCFDPLSGKATGACSLPGDPGPTRPVMTFAKCCGGGGSCVPPELVASDQQQNVARETCSGTELCVPQGLIDGVAPSQCASIGGFEGRCLASCLPVVSAQGDRLPRSTCAVDQRCAPCSDPFTGKSSGACTLPGDSGPRAQPGQFTRCCNGAAFCLPLDLVQNSQRASLDSGDCGSDQLCVPEQLSMGVAPTSCNSIAGAEGRCLSSCLPLVAAQATQLPRSTCAADERCAPCFDPFSGKATGSCMLPGDPGPARPPLVFSNCCDLDGAARGRCVPPALVPSTKQALLMAAGCSGGDLCLPSTLEPPATALPACTSSAGSSGACVPTCLLNSSQSLAVTQGTCHTWERCVPCMVLGTPSGVCD
jgi:hypothetical protein